jgi:hypothetical protein
VPALFPAIGRNGRLVKKQDEDASNADHGAGENGGLFGGEGFVDKLVDEAGDDGIFAAPGQESTQVRFVLTSAHWIVAVR